MLFYWDIPPSLGLPRLVLISWLSDPFVDLYELSPRASLTVILFRASPYHQLVQGIPLLSSRLGHPPTVILFKASPYHQLVQGIPLLSSCLRRPPIVILFKAFPHRQFVQGIPFLLGSPPWIRYLWASINFHHHGFSSFGFRDYHHHRFSSMGILGSPPQIKHLRALISFYHHRFSSMVISDSPPQIFIYGPRSVFTTMDFHPWAFEIITTIDVYLWAFKSFTTIDWHLWAFLLYHHRRSSPMGLLVQCLELDFWFGFQSHYFSQFSVQSQSCHLESQLLTYSYSLAFTSYLHGFAFVLSFPHFVTLCLLCIHHVAHIGQSPLDTFLSVLQGGSTVIYL